MNEKSSREEFIYNVKNLLAGEGKIYWRLKNISQVHAMFLSSPL